MKYRISHRTEYTYAETVSLSHDIVRQRPRDEATQTCLHHELLIDPIPRTKSESLDYFANHRAYFSIEKAHDRLVIDSRSEVELVAPSTSRLESQEPWEQAARALLEPADPQTLLAREFSFDSPYVTRAPELAAYTLPFFKTGAPLLRAVLDLTKRIHEDFEFQPGSTRIGTPVLDVLRNRCGVCQDFAHLEIGCLRSLGLAARYVSGYLVTSPPPGQKRLVGADVSHAWLSVYSPDLGWVDFDPTNGVAPSTGHITVAFARDYDDLGPIRGILVGGRRQRLNVAVDVVPVEAA